MCNIPWFAKPVWLIVFSLKCKYVNITLALRIMKIRFRILSVIISVIEAE